MSVHGSVAVADRSVAPKARMCTAIRLRMSDRGDPRMWENVWERQADWQRKFLSSRLLALRSGGESGIRTHGRVSPTHAFQACAFNHSAISPSLESTTCERLRADYRTRRAISEALLEHVCIQWFGSDDCQCPRELGLTRHHASAARRGAPVEVRIMSRQSRTGAHPAALCIDIDDGISESPRRFLWQVVTDAAFHQPVGVLARELLSV
jgi:hypothetical protein